MTNTKKLEKVTDLVNQIAITIGIIGKSGSDDEKAKLSIALGFSEAFLKFDKEEETEEDDDYQGSDAYYDSNC